MSQEQPSLSQLMVRYPFTPQSRGFFDKLPIEESFSSTEVLKQAENRLLSAIGRIRYEPHLSELIEFSSFFVSALVASQDAYMGQRFAEKEGDYAKKSFIKEGPREKPRILFECFGIELSLLVPAKGAYVYFLRVEDYLAVVTRYELTKLQRWKLVNQALAGGLVYLTDNDTNDLLEDLSERLVYEGVKNLRRVSFPKQLIPLRDGLLPYLPPPKVKSTRGYLYVEELLSHPVSDGRHRLTWLVLAPYLVNVKKVEEDDAVERIRSFVAAKGETRSMKRFIEYNVKRAKRNGLMPPTLNKLRSEHPDLYALLPKEVTRNRVGGS